MGKNRGAQPPRHAKPYPVLLVRPFRRPRNRRCRLFRSRSCWRVTEAVPKHWNRFMAHHRPSLPALFQGSSLHPPLNPSLRRGFAPGPWPLAGRQLACKRWLPLFPGPDILAAIHLVSSSDPPARHRVATYGRSTRPLPPCAITVAPLLEPPPLLRRAAAWRWLDGRWPPHALATWAAGVGGVCAVWWVLAGWVLSPRSELGRAAALRGGAASETSETARAARRVSCRRPRSSGFFLRYHYEVVSGRRRGGCKRRKG